MLENKGIAFYTKCITNQVSKRVNERITSEGLTKSQFDVLLFVIQNFEKENPIKQKDIEQFFHISNPTVSGLLTRLELKDLIKRTQNPKDMRIHYIVPTDNAIALANNCREELDKMEQEMTEGISKEEVNTALDVLRQILANLTREGGDADDQNPCCSD